MRRLITYWLFLTLSVEKQKNILGKLTAAHNKKIILTAIRKGIITVEEINRLRNLDRPVETKEVPQLMEDDTLQAIKEYQEFIDHKPLNCYGVDCAGCDFCEPVQEEKEEEKDTAPTQKEVTPTYKKVHKNFVDNTIEYILKQGGDYWEGLAKDLYSIAKKANNEDSVPSYLPFLRFFYEHIKEVEDTYDIVISRHSVNGCVYFRISLRGKDITMKQRVPFIRKRKSKKQKQKELPDRQKEINDIVYRLKDLPLGEPMYLRGDAYKNYSRAFYSASKIRGCKITCSKISSDLLQIIRIK